MEKLAQLNLPGGYQINYPAGFEFSGSDITDVVNVLAIWAFGIVGLIFLFILISGGFQLLTSAGNPEKVKSGQSKIINALIGLIVVMAAYWIVQILQVIFDIKILTS